jgi:CheY-like chemotaxis protein
MLRRIIGDNIALHLNLHGAPLMIRADAGMLDQVLLNLAVNARDAMPLGGRLTIETSETKLDAETASETPEAAPGRHVCLTVSDTGSGIPPEVLPHIFEPFFTTKEPGKGTGLGLATVFGVIKQHRGFVKVLSPPHQGATFHVCLPASSAIAPIHAIRQPQPLRSAGGTETILLVEDESAVRLLSGAVLERAGYRVLCAANGLEALRLWEENHGKVHLLLTDIMMPEGLSGFELADTLQSRQPRLRALFTSGYSGEHAGRERTLREGQNFLQKPAAIHHLLQTVRRVLDN